MQNDHWEWLERVLGCYSLAWSQPGQQKCLFLKWFSSIYLIWPYFGHKNWFLPKKCKFEPNLGSNLRKTHNFEHFGTKKSWKWGIFPKIYKKAPNFWPFFSHEFSRKIKSSSFLIISGPLMNVDPESCFTEDYKNHIETMAQCCPLEIYTVLEIQPVMYFA